MKSKNIIIVGVVVVLVLVGGYWFMSKKNTSPKQEPPKNEVADMERTQIAAAIINQQSVLGTKDVVKVKAYLSKIYSTPEDKKEFLKLTNAELLKQAAAITAGGSITTEELLSKNAVWNVAPDIAVVQLTRNGKPLVYTVQKFEDAWY